MEAVVLILLMYFLYYLINIVRLISGYLRVKEFLSGYVNPEIKFSIIVPFRDESKNLPTLLDSIAKLNYPPTHFELILVNDFSTDDSETIIYRWRVTHSGIQTTMIDNVLISGSPKKDALTRAVPIAVHPWIVTTDADCTLPPDWLQTFNAFIQKTGCEMVAAPVVLDNEKGFLNKFQQADIISLQAATIGGFGMQRPFMCNGANFAYSKKLFNSLRGFLGNNDKASGDDVFLLQKAVADDPGKVKYLLSDSALVKTRPSKSVSELFFSRVRWASKAAAYENDFAETLSISVFLGNLSVVTITIFSFFGMVHWQLATGMYLIKFLIDYTLLFMANRFFRRGKFIFPIIGSLVYPFFSTSVALYSLFGRYRWKGRKLK